MLVVGASLAVAMSYLMIFALCKISGDISREEECRK